MAYKFRLHSATFGYTRLQKTTFLYFLKILINNSQLVNYVADVAGKNMPTI